MKNGVGAARRFVVDRSRLKWLPPLLAVGYNLIVLRQQLLVVPSGNDSAVHLAYIRWVHDQVQQGRLPLDGWFPNLQLGAAVGKHYQLFPELLTGMISGPLGVEQTYRVLLYVLLATWPISVYLGARLFDWGWPASLAALVSPLLTSVTGYGYEHLSYVWQGYGLYTQLWAMSLMPLVWGLTWRAVDRGRHLVWASLALGLLVCCHFLSGYLALGLVVIWVVCVPARFWTRFLRAAVVVVGAMAVASWALVPVFLDRAYQLDSQFLQGTFWRDSYGAATVIGWLAGGQLLDSGRLVVITVSAAVGLAVSLARVRVDARARALLGALALSLFLFAGRPTFGPLIGLLPANQELLLHRYLFGVQLAGTLLAGVGLTHVGRQMLKLAGERTARRWVKPAAATAIFAILLVGLVRPALQVAGADGLFAAQALSQREAERTQGADVKALVSEATRLGGGRIYAGNQSDWGSTFKVGYIPVFVELLNDDADLVGFSLRIYNVVSDAEAQFDSHNPAQYALFGVRYLLMPAGLRPPVTAVPIARRGAAALWMVEGSTYLEVVDIVPPVVTANRHDLGRQGGTFLRSDDLRNGRYHAVAYEGGAAPPATSARGSQSQGPAGTIEVESHSSTDGSFVAQATAARPAVVLLKTAYDPGWRITVDGASTPSMMVLPGLLGVRVSDGSHRLTFHYQSFGGYPELFALALLGLLGVWWLRRILPAERVDQSQLLAS
jgi:hypothetical protein